jgi:polar amino acid transport system permease protein
VSLSLDYQTVLEYWPDLLSGAILTMEITVVAAIFGLILGIFGAIGRRSKIRLVSTISGIYVEVIRNTPFLIQIFLVYFGLAVLGLKLSAFTVAIGALTINTGAYTTEIMRAGFDAVPRAQIESAEGLALSPFQIYWHIVLLPAMENVYPSLTSQFVLMMLASSICSQISAEELTGVATYIQSTTFRAFATYIVIAVIYVMLSFVLRAGFWGLGLFLFPRRRRLGAWL